MMKANIQDLMNSRNNKVADSATALQASESTA